MRNVYKKMINIKTEKYLDQMKTKDYRQLELDKIDNWLDFNIGPSDFSKMPERTAKIIDDFL